MLTAASTAACGGSHHPAATPQPPPGSSSTTTTVAAPPSPAQANLDTSASLALAVPSAPNNWNPLAVGGNSAATALISAGVLPSAYQELADGSYQLNTEFVTSVEATGRRPQVVVYHLNPKATWSDGNAITANDFVYTWEADSGNSKFKDLGGQPFSPVSTLGYADIVSVRATAGDPDTVTVTFGAAFADWKSLFGPILPAQVAQSVGFDHGFTDPVNDDVSGGPFLVQSEVPGRSVTLVRNARYWGPPAALSSLVVDFAGPPAVGGALMAGQLGAALLDITQVPSSGGLLAQLRSTTGLKVDEAPGAEWEDLEFGSASPLLADPALRQAIVLAVDRSALITAAVGSPSGIVPLGNRYFLPQSAGYVDNTQAHYLHANLAQAQRVLASGGYALSGGVLSKGTTPVVLNLIAGVRDSLHEAEEAALVSDLSAIGIAVHVSVVADLAGRLAQGNFDMAIVERTGSSDPQSQPLPTFVDQPVTASSAHTTSKAAQVAAGATPAVRADVAALEKKADAATTVAAQDALYNQLDALLWLDAASLPLFQLPTVLVYQTRYANLSVMSTPGGLGYDMAQWGVPNRS